MFQSTGHLEGQGRQIMMDDCQKENDVLFFPSRCIIDNWHPVYERQLKDFYGRQASVGKNVFVFCIFTAPNKKLVSTKMVDVAKFTIYLKVKILQRSLRNIEFGSGLKLKRPKYVLFWLVRATHNGDQM